MRWFWPDLRHHNNSGTFQLQGDEAVSVAPNNASGSTVEYMATFGSRDVKSWTYKTLKINGSGGIFTVPVGGLTLGENLIVAAGTFDANDQPLSINGTTTITGGTMKTGTNTITFGDNTGADNVTISGTGQLQIESSNTTTGIVLHLGTGSWTNTAGTITYNCATGVSTSLLSSLSPYYNLTINSSGSTYTANGAIVVNAALAYKPEPLAKLQIP